MPTPDDLQERFLRLTFDLVAYDAFDHLHWGLWRDVPKEPRRFTEAREAYADELVAWVPSDARRILDVGCGLCGIAKMLAERGHRVTAITPRADHHERLAARPIDGLELRRGRFEDFSAGDGPFDLVLFGESFNFFADDIAGTLARASSLLAPGGQVLIAELLAPTAREALEASGWSMVRSKDVTEDVAFTVEALQAAFDRYVLPYQQLQAAALELVDDALAQRVTDALHEVPNRAVASLFRGRVAEDEMLAHARYLFFLLAPAS